MRQVSGSVSSVQYGVEGTASIDVVSTELTNTPLGLTAGTVCWTVSAEREQKDHI